MHSSLVQDGPMLWHKLAAKKYLMDRARLRNQGQNQRSWSGFLCHSAHVCATVCHCCAAVVLMAERLQHVVKYIPMAARSLILGVQRVCSTFVPRAAQLGVGEGGGDAATACTVTLALESLPAACASWLPAVLCCPVSMFAVFGLGGDVAVHVVCACQCSTGSTTALPWL